MDTQINSKKIPFKDTPVLYGEDAKKFLKAIDNQPPISDDVKERMIENFNKFQSINNSSLSPLEFDLFKLLILSIDNMSDLNPVKYLDTYLYFKKKFNL
jgi:hypothetical protein